MSGERYVIGVDFGTLSGRALVMRVRDGVEVGTAVFDYPHAVLDRSLPVLADGTPLCELPECGSAGRGARDVRVVNGGIIRDLSGNVVPGSPRSEWSPSSDTADEFGGEIPVGPLVVIGADSIGCGVVGTLSGHRSRAIPMRNHGVFTIGKDARNAVEAVVMEDVACTVSAGQRPAAHLTGSSRCALWLLPKHLRAEDRSTELMTAQASLDGLEVWFLTGSQQLYGKEALREVAEQSRSIAGATRARAPKPRAVAFSALGPLS